MSGRRSESSPLAGGGPPESYEDRLRAFAERMSAIVPPPSGPSEPHREDPISAAALTEHVTRTRGELAEAARRAHRQVDGEAVHDLRVAARRLIAALTLWRELFRGGSRRKALRRLRSLRRRLGPLRELEAHAAMLEDLHRRGGAVADSVEILLAGHRHSLARERARAAEQVRPRRVRGVLERLDRSAAAIDVRALEHPEAAARARERAARQARRAVAALGAALEGRGDQALHRARIAVKKWRYALETLRAATGREPHPPLESLREIQEILGSIQDGASLRATLVASPTDEIPELLRPLVDELERVRSAALDRLLSAAPALLRRLSFAVVAPTGR